MKNSPFLTNIVSATKRGDPVQFTDLVLRSKLGNGWRDFEREVVKSLLDEGVFFKESVGIAKKQISFFRLNDTSFPFHQLLHLDTARGGRLEKVLLAAFLKANIPASGLLRLTSDSFKVPDHKETTHEKYWENLVNIAIGLHTSKDLPKFLTFISEDSLFVVPESPITSLGNYAPADTVALTLREYVGHQDFLHESLAGFFKSFVSPIELSSKLGGIERPLSAAFRSEMFEGHAPEPAVLSEIIEHTRHLGAVLFSVPASSESSPACLLLTRDPEALVGIGSYVTTQYARQTSVNSSAAFQARRYADLLSEN